MTQNNFLSVSFGAFYRSVHGAEININFRTRSLDILDEQQVVVCTVMFSKSIQHHFSQIELFNEQLEKGQLSYNVYINGYDDKHWLFCGEVSGTLLL